MNPHFGAQASQQKKISVKILGGCGGGRGHFGSVAGSRNQEEVLFCRCGNTYASHVPNKNTPHTFLFCRSQIFRIHFYGKTIVAALWIQRPEKVWILFGPPSRHRPKGTRSKADSKKAAEGTLETTQQVGVRTVPSQL